MLRATIIGASVLSAEAFTANVRPSSGIVARASTPQAAVGLVYSTVTGELRQTARGAPQY